MSLTNKSEITVRFLTKLGRLLLLFYEQTVETMSNEHGHLYLQTPMSKEQRQLETAEKKAEQTPYLHNTGTEQTTKYLKNSDGRDNISL